MRRPPALLLAPGLLAALAGCSSTGPASPPPTASTAAAAAAPAGPTVKQFASVVARAKADLQKSATDLEPCSFPQGIQAYTCSLVVHTATLNGQILAKDLRKVGTPPAEVTQLVTDTLKAADELGANDITGCSKGQEESAGCAGTLTRVGFYVDSTLRTLAGWEPYSS